MPRTKASVSGVSFLEGQLGSGDLNESLQNASSFSKKRDEMEKAFFGVLYTMIRFSGGYNKISILRILLDFLRIFFYQECDMLILT
jgi:hypothetical protein